MTSKFHATLREEVKTDCDSKDLAKFKKALDDLLEEIHYVGIASRDAFTLTEEQVKSLLPASCIDRNKIIEQYKPDVHMNSYLMLCQEMKSYSGLNAEITKMVKDEYDGDYIEQEHIMLQYNPMYYRMHLQAIKALKVVDGTHICKMGVIFNEFIENAKSELAEYIELLDVWVRQADKRASESRIIELMDEEFDKWAEHVVENGPAFMKCPSVRDAIDRFVTELDDDKIICKKADRVGMKRARDDSDDSGDSSDESD